ncbi:hypothetical protein ACTFIU_005702 [Dictyostelium citrinum]
MDQQQQPNGMMQMNGEQQNTPTIPQNRTISLSLVIHRLVEQSYNSLLGLTEGLPKANDLERKKAIVDYLDSTREKFLRLMVLIKWSEHVPTLTKANNIIDILNLEDSYLREAADLLINTQFSLVNARAPIYDVPTAIDVLTTGTYQRMPTNIKRVIPPPPLKPNQIESALERLNDIIKYKLFISEVPKEFQPITVSDGKAHIVVDDEYEAYLTIDGGSEKSNWVILSLNLFVYSKRNLNGEGPIKVAYDNKMKYVLDRVQNRITSSAQPLFELHNIVHYLCISSQMDILASQVENLKKTILKNNIRCVFGKDQSITVFYWLPEDFNLVGVTQHTLGNLMPNKHTNFKIYIDEHQKIKISHYPPITHPKNENYFKIASLNLETILLQAIELNAYDKVYLLNSLLLDNRITASNTTSPSTLSPTINRNINNGGKPNLLSTKQSNNPLSRSFHLNDIKLIMSSRFSDENQNDSNGNNDHLPTVLRVMLYGSKFLDITVNFQNGKFSLIKSSNYIEFTSHLEQRLNRDPNEIESIVNVFKLKSLLTCFEEASLFLGLECFNKIPLQMNSSSNSESNQLANELFSESNFICVSISLPKENNPYYLVISIKATCFTPSFHLLFCKMIPKSAIMTLDSIIKLESDQLNKLLKECPIGSISSSNNTNSNGNGPFQSYISTLLEKIVEASNQKINLLSIQSFLKKENINYYQPSQDIENNNNNNNKNNNDNNNNKNNGITTTTSIIFLFNEQQIQKISPFLSNHISHQTPITISFKNGFYTLSFTQQRPFEYKKYGSGIGNANISSYEENDSNENYTYRKGNWIFKYQQTSDWFNSFCNDLMAISKITNISSQLLKQMETLEIYKQLITHLTIKPMSIEFICFVGSNQTRTNVTMFVERKTGEIKLSFQPYSNPLLVYLEKDINQSPTNDITNSLRAIINSNDISAYINSLISPLELTFYLPLEILVIPRSICQIRLLYKNLYGIDIKLISHEYCAISDSFYSLNSSKQVRLTSINQLHSFMEQRVSLQALDNPTGHRTSWLLPIKQFQKTISRIFIYLNSLNTLKFAQNLMKPNFQPLVPSNPSSQKFSNDYFIASFSIRDYTSFDIDVTNKNVENSVPSNEELALFCQYFKKKVQQLNYRSQTIGSCIQMLTLPPKILWEFIRVLLEITGPKFDGYTIEISLNTSSIHSKNKESFIHIADENQVYFILRYLNSSRTDIIPPDQFTDIPIIYNYNEKSIRYWNKLDPNVTSSTTLPKKSLPIVEEIKQKFVEEVAKLIPEALIASSGKSSPISIFFKSFLPKIKPIFSNPTASTLLLLQQQQQQPPQPQIENNNFASASSSIR